VDINKIREKEWFVSHERNRGEPKNPLQHEYRVMSVAEHNFKNKKKKRKEKYKREFLKLLNKK
jgi:hypothetical protein